MKIIEFVDFRWNVRCGCGRLDDTRIVIYILSLCYMLRYMILSYAYGAMAVLSADSSS